MFEYETTGTCCKKIGVKLNGKIIEDVSFEGGCHGNLKAWLHTPRHLRHFGPAEYKPLL